jgi:hypothetical protein
MKKLTKTQAAQKLGVSRPTLYSLIKKGVITPDENGLIALNDDHTSLSDASLHDVNDQKSFHDVRSILESSGHIKAKFRAKYIAQMEKTIEHLEAELGNVRNELALTRKQLSRYQNSRRQLIRESADLSQDTSPVVPAETGTLNKLNKTNILYEKQIGLLEQEISRLQVENKALRAAVGKSTPEQYLVTSYTQEVYKPYDTSSPNFDPDEDFAKEIGISTWQKKPTEELLHLS